MQELNKKQELLITEREWLLREIHHRVKNNLQTTMSLLNMQTNYLSSTDAIDAIKNSQGRMYAMSLVHQKLYQSDNLSTINIKSFIDELVQYLSESFHRSQEINFELFIDDIELDLAMAIPVGLIINEAVTNSIKYAFPDNRSGKIVIGFIKRGADELLLSIKDDGVGLPDAVNSDTNNSLGLNLIKGLTSQIEGDIEIDGSLGMALSVTFKNIRQKEQRFQQDI